MWFYYLIEIFILKNWNIFRNALLNSKLLAVNQREKLFINSKLFTSQKNLIRVHLWGTFAKPLAPSALVGYCGLSIKKGGNLIDRRKWKHRKNIFLNKILNISKNKALFGKRGYRLGEKACMYHYQKRKIEIDSIVWELNPELWKMGVLPQTL